MIPGLRRCASENAVDVARYAALAGPVQEHQLDRLRDVAGVAACADVLDLLDCV
jgi:hypothetical protein